jgi:hypothetical protein
MSNRTSPSGPISVFTATGAAGVLPAMVAGDVQSLSLATPGAQNGDIVMTASNATLRAAGLIVVAGGGFAVDSCAFHIIATKAFGGGTSGNIAATLFRP